MVAPSTLSSITRTSLKVPQPTFVKSETYETTFKSVFEILKSWNMINTQGILQFASKVTPHPLSGTSLNRFNALLRQDIHLQIGRFHLRMTQEEYAKGLNQSFSKLGETQTYLRGSYALYIVNMASYFEELIEDYLHGKPEKEVQRKRKEIAPFLNELKKKWEEMQPPKDIDWLDVVDCTAHDAELSLSFFLIDKESRLDSKEIKKRAFSKHVKTYPTHLKMEQGTSFLIYSLATEKVTTDRATGNLRHTSIASFCDLCIPIEKLAPQSLVGNFPQVVADWGMKAIRLKDWHSLNFPALAAFCQYSYQEFEFFSDVHSLADAFTHVSYVLKENDEAYSELLKDIDSRMGGHKVEPISFLFSMALQFYLVSAKELGKLWNDLLSRMQDCVKEKDKENIDFRLVQFFALFKEDFSKLPSALVHLCAVTPFFEGEGVSISHFTKDAVILKVGNSHLYLRKDLFKQKLSNAFPKELEQFISSHHLKHRQKLDKNIQEITDAYHETTSLAEAEWNPYLLFIHLSKVKPSDPPTTLMKRFLKLVVHPDTPVDQKERLIDWLSPWYSGLSKRKIPPKGPDALAEIAKTSITDAFDTLEAMGTQKKIYLIPFLRNIASSHPKETLEKLGIAQGSQKERFEILEQILKSSRSDEKTVKDGITLLKKQESLPPFTPSLIRKLWKNTIYLRDGNALLLFAMEQGSLSATDCENLIGELLTQQEGLQALLFFYKIPTSYVLSNKIKAKFDRIQIDAKALGREDKEIILVYVETLLPTRPQEALIELKRFKDYWDRETYATLFLKILRAGIKDHAFVLKTSDETLQIEDTLVQAGIRSLLKEFFSTLLKRNLHQSIQLLFSPLIKSAYGEDKKDLQDLLLEELLDMNPSFDKEKNTVRLLEKMMEDVPRHASSIDQILKAFSQGWIQDQPSRLHLQNLLKSHCHTLITYFHGLKRFSTLSSIQHLLNLLDIGSDPRHENIHLETLERQFLLDLFCTSLKNGRFLGVTPLRTKLLQEALRESKKEGRDENFRLCLQNLAVDTPIDVLRELKTALKGRPSTILAILDRFSLRENFVIEMLQEFAEEIYSLPTEKLCHYLKQWSETFSDKVSLHPLLKVLLRKERVKVSLLLDAVLALEFYHLKEIYPLVAFVIDQEKDALRKSCLKLLLQFDGQFDQQSTEYKLVWQKVIENAPTCSHPSSLFLSLAKDDERLERTGTASFKGALVKACVIHATEEQVPQLIEAIQILRNLGLTKEALAILECMIQKFEDLKFFERKLIYDDIWNFLHSLLLKNVASGLCSEDFDKNFFIDLDLLISALVQVLNVYCPANFTDIHTLISAIPHKTDLFIQALLNHPISLTEVVKLIIDSLQDGRFVTKESAELVIKRMRQQNKMDVHLPYMELFDILYEKKLIDEAEYRWKAPFHAWKMQGLVQEASFGKNHLDLLFITLELLTEDDFDRGSFKIAMEAFFQGVARALTYKIFPQKLTLADYVYNIAQKPRVQAQENMQGNVVFYNLTELPLGQLPLTISSIEEESIHQIYVGFAKKCLEIYVDDGKPIHPVFKNLFFFGLSLTQDNGLTHPVIGPYLHKLGSLFDRNISTSLKSGLLDGDSIEEEALFQVVEDIVKFPSNFTLERVFTLLFSYLQKFPGKTLSFGCLHSIFMSLRKRKQIKLELTYIDRFVDLYAKNIDQDREAAENYKNNYSIFFETFVLLQEFFEDSNFQGYIRLWNKILKIALDRNFIKYHNYLNELFKYIDKEVVGEKFLTRVKSYANEIVDSDPNFKDSSFAIICDALLYKKHLGQESEISKRNQVFLNWVHAFYSNLRTAKHANLYLHDYIEALKNYRGKNFYKDMEYLRPCIQANRGNHGALPLIANFLSEKQSSKAVLDTQAEEYVKWVTPFLAKEIDVVPRMILDLEKKHVLLFRKVRQSIKDKYVS